MLSGMSISLLCVGDVTSAHRLCACMNGRGIALVREVDVKQFRKEAGSVQVLLALVNSSQTESRCMAQRPLKLYQEVATVVFDEVFDLEFGKSLIRLGVQDYFDAKEVT